MIGYYMTGIGYHMFDYCKVFDSKWPQPFLVEPLNLNSVINFSCNYWCIVLFFSLKSLQQSEIFIYTFLYLCCYINLNHSLENPSFYKSIMFWYIFYIMVIYYSGWMTIPSLFHFSGKGDSIKFTLILFLNDVVLPHQTGKKLTMWW